MADSGAEAGIGGEGVGGDGGAVIWGSSMESWSLAVVIIPKVPRNT